MKKLSRAAVTAALTSSLVSALTGTAGPANANPIPSSNCDAGFQVVENTSQGVHVKLYTLTSANVTRVCVRVEQVPNGAGRGGELVITMGLPGVGVGNVWTPTNDRNATACTATAPNAVPGTHPISYGGIAGVPYLVDAAFNGTTAQLCVLAGTEAHRVVVPVQAPTVGVDPGPTVVFNRDPGT